MSSQNKTQPLQSFATPIAAQPFFAVMGLWLRRRGWLIVLLVAMTGLLGRGDVTALGARDHRIGALVGGESFDLLAWEIDAVIEKLSTAATLRLPPPEVAVQIVRAYVEDANRLGQLEAEIAQSVSEGGAEATVAPVAHRT